MMVRISLRNLQRARRLNLAALRKSAEQAVELVGKIRRKKVSALDRLEEILVVLISDRRMAQLHQRFLHQSGPTDVITFDHGEIFISVDTAQRNARRFGTSLQREIELYVIHGLLHLRGFDDRSLRDAKQMDRVQRRILDALN